MTQYSMTEEETIASVLPSVWSLALKYALGERRLMAEDLFEAAQLRLVTAYRTACAKPKQAQTNVQGYLYTAARNAMIDVLRAQKSQTSVSLDAKLENGSTLSEMIADDADPFLHVIDNEENVEWLLAGLSRPIYREIVVRRVGLNGHYQMSYEEIVEELGISVGQARKGAFRAFAELRSMLQGVRA